MARVGWVAAQAETGTGGTDVQWLRLSVFDDGWVEVPTFGRAVASVRGNLRTALLNVGALVVGLAVVWGALELAALTDGVLSGMLRVFGVLLLIGGFGTLLVRSFRLQARQAQRRIADGEDLRARKAAGTLPGRAPGAPMWRRADNAEQFSSWLTHTTMIRATDVSAVTVVPDPADTAGQQATVLLHSGEQRRYRSPDATLGELLMRFGTAGS